MWQCELIGLLARLNLVKQCKLKEGRTGKIKCKVYLRNPGGENWGLCYTLKAMIVRLLCSVAIMRHIYLYYCIPV